MFWQRCQLYTGSDATVSGIKPMATALHAKDTGLIIQYLSPQLKKCGPVTTRPSITVAVHLCDSRLTFVSYRYCFYTNMSNPQDIAELHELFGTCEVTDQATRALMIGHEGPALPI
jgi:hypothetical protein